MERSVWKTFSRLKWLQNQNLIKNNLKIIVDFTWYQRPYSVDTHNSFYFQVSKCLRQTFRARKNSKNNRFDNVLIKKFRKYFCSLSFFWCFSANLRRALLSCTPCDRMFGRHKLSQQLYFSTATREINFFSNSARTNSPVQIPRVTHKFHFFDFFKFRQSLMPG